MKILFFFWLFVFSVSLSGQKYTFNTKATSVLKKKDAGSKKENTYYFNTEDYGYYLSFINVQGKELAILHDLRNRKESAFELQRENGNDIFKFNNTTAVARPANKVSIIEKIDDNKRIVHLFYTKNSKKPYCNFTMTLQRSDKDFYPIFYETAFGNPEALKNLDLGGNYKVTSAEFETADYKLTNMQPASLELEVPHS